jgi:hypothetical protein
MLTPAMNLEDLKRPERASKGRSRAVAERRTHKRLEVSFLRFALERGLF